MVTPGMRVERESEAGLWPGTAGFAVRIGDGGPAGLLVPVTAAAYTRESPIPQGDSRCSVGGTGGLSVDRHLSPASLAEGPHFHDFAVVVVPDEELGAALPDGAGGPVPGNPADPTPRSVKVAVERGGSVVALDGTLELLADSVLQHRPVEPPGGVVAVTYESPFRLETTEPLTDEDVGAAIYEADGGAVALGVVLVRDSGSTALATDIRRILRRLPQGSELVGGGG